MKLVYTIILNYNSSNESIRLFNSIKSNEHFDIMTFVIDNHSGSKAEYDNLLKNIPNDQLIFNHANNGYAAGNNIGIKKAIKDGADYIFILNPDISLSSDTIEVLVKTLQEDPTLAVVGPRICDKGDPNLIYSDGGVIDAKNGYVVSHINHNKKRTSLDEDLNRKVDYVNGSAMLINSKAVKDLGYLNENFFLYFEEAEYCLRAQNSPWNIVTNTNTTAYHLRSKKGNTYAFYMARNQIWLAKMRGNSKIASILPTIKSVYWGIRRSILNEKKISSYSYSRIRGFIAGILFSPNKKLK